jgi:Ca-activated chloride channel homolog
VSNSLILTRLLLVSFGFLLPLSAGIWHLPASAAAQSIVPPDVKRDTPGKSIQQGQSVHIDVTLALVNVTVTDPYDRVVTGLEPDNFRVFENNIEQEIQYFISVRTQ